MSESTTKPRNIVYRDAYPDPNDPGMWRVPGVPVFGCVGVGSKTDEEITDADLRQFAELNNTRADGGHYRALHHGHQKLRDDGTPDLNGDQPLLAFCENWRVLETTWGPILHVDLWGIDEFTLSQFERGRFSYISVEADISEIVSIAAMQSRPPYFEFPNLFVRRAKPGSDDGDESPTLYAREVVALRRQFAKSYPVKRYAMDDEKNDDMPPMPFGDDEDEPDQYADGDESSDDNDVEQFADDGAAPAGGDGPPAPAQPAEPDMNTQMMTILQQILAAVQQPAAPAVAPAAPAAAPVAPQAPVQHGAVPNTLRPLEPASSAQYATDGAATQFARLAPEDRKLMEQVSQFARDQHNARELRALLSEARASGATPEELALLEAQHNEAPKAAKQFAAHLRTRGPAPVGAPRVTAVNVPASVVTAGIKQFGGDGVNVNDPAIRAVAEKARQDWVDTCNDHGPDGRAMRAQFAGEAGCQKWIALQLKHATQRRQFGRGA